MVSGSVDHTYCIHVIPHGTFLGEKGFKQLTTSHIFRKALLLTTETLVNEAGEMIMQINNSD